MRTLNSGPYTVANQNCIAVARAMGRIFNVEESTSSYYFGRLVYVIRLHEAPKTRAKMLSLLWEVGENTRLSEGVPAARKRELWQRQTQTSSAYVLAPKLTSKEAAENGLVLVTLVGDRKTPVIVVEPFTTEEQ